MLCTLIRDESMKNRIIVSILPQEVKLCWSYFAIRTVVYPALSTFNTELVALAVVIVATSPVVLRLLRDSPRAGCARRTTTYICGANKQ